MNNNETDDHDDMIESRDTHQDVRRLMREIGLKKEKQAESAKMSNYHKKPIKSKTKRLCKCGCGKSIAHKHPNAKFLNQRHKDSYHNWTNPRGKFAHLNTDHPDYDVDLEEHPFSSDALGQW